MHLKFITRKLLMVALPALVLCGCNRSSVKEPPITGKSSDAPVSMPARWQEAQRYIYRVEAMTTTHLPRKNTQQMIQADTRLAQDLAFTVTNVAPDGSRSLQMEILSVQMDTGREDGYTMSYDSLNRVIQVDDTPLVQRLRRFVGLKLTFRVSAENRVIRMDGMKELTDRMSGMNSVRGVAGGIMARYFNPQFFRDIVEMGMLPRDPLKVGDVWTVARQTSTGSSGASMPMEFTYEFTGWQLHEGTNCARIDFSGEYNPNALSQTNASFLRQVVKSATSAKIDEGTIIGKSWYDPALSLAVETAYEQTVVTKPTKRRARVKRDPREGDDDAASVTDEASPQPEDNNSSVFVTPPSTTHQFTHIKLLEIETLQK